MKTRPTDILELALAACERDDGTGICRSCGHEHEGLEPDARNRVCENCGKAQVFGAEELVVMLAG